MQPGLVGPIAYDGADGADQPGDFAGRDQYALEQIRCGRLAICPGDADQRHDTARVIVPGRVNQASASRPSFTWMYAGGRTGRATSGGSANDRRGSTRRERHRCSGGRRRPHRVSDKSAPGLAWRESAVMWLTWHALRTGCGDHIRQAKQKRGKLHPTGLYCSARLGAALATVHEDPHLRPAAITIGAAVAPHRKEKTLMARIRGSGGVCVAARHRTAGSARAANALCSTTASGFANQEDHHASQHWNGDQFRQNRGAFGSRSDPQRDAWLR